jgi:DNA-binding response OmpR family regulator
MEQPVRILVADDEPAMLSLNANFLRQKGFDVTEASDGEAAWKLALHGDFDLLLLDVMMPGMSGWEVCKRVKQTPSTQGTAVVMLTGMGETLNDMNSPLFSADTWLDKPFDFDELERKIRDTLTKYGKESPPPGAPVVPAKKSKAAPKKGAAKAAKKPAAKKPASKKAAPKAAAKKAAPKKAAAKKPAAKKAAPKKAAAKKPAAKKPAAKKKK